MKAILFTATLLWSNVICISAQVSLVGTASPAQDWATPYPMLPSGEPGIYTISIFLTNGEIRFVREMVPDSIGGIDFPEGTGEVGGPGIFVNASGFYLVTFDSLSLDYSFASGRVGINTLYPTSTLTVQGGISTTGLVIPVDDGPISIPDNVSYVTVTGDAADSIMTFLPFSYGSGLRLIVENISNQPLRVTSNFQSYTVVPVMGAVEFIKSSGFGWTPIAVSGTGTPNTPMAWELRGNANTQADSNFIGTIDSTRLSFRTDSVEHMNISARGHVGIGTADPDNFLYKLDVTSNTGHVLRLNTSNNSDSLDKTTLLFHSDNLFRGEISTLKPSSSPARMGFFTGQSIPILGIYPQEQISITSGGNVGVFKTNPSQRLDINGKVKIGNDTQPPSEGTIRWNQTTNDFEGYTGNEWVSLTKSRNGGWGGNDMITEDESETMPVPDHYRRMGWSIDMDNEFAVIGENINTTYYNGSDDKGKVYVFKYHAANQEWIMHDTLRAIGEFNGRKFGYSVSLTPLYLIVGAPDDYNGALDLAGKVYIFKRYGDEFIEEAVLAGTEEFEYFGRTADLNESGHLIVGSPGSDKTSIFFIWGTGFTPYAELLTTAIRPVTFVSISNNNYAYISDDTDPNVDAYHYESQGGYNYYHVGTITGIGGPLGCFDRINTEPGWLMVGNPLADVSGQNDQGETRVYKRTGNTWTLTTTLISGDGNVGDKFGSCIAMHENYCVIGAPGAEVGDANQQGKAYVYYRTGDSWSQNAILSNSSGSTSHQLGWAAGISNRFVCVGAPFQYFGSSVDQGAVHFFRK